MKNQVKDLTNHVFRIVCIELALSGRKLIVGADEIGCNQWRNLNYPSHILPALLIAYILLVVKNMRAA